MQHHFCRISQEKSKWSSLLNVKDITQISHNLSPILDSQKQYVGGKEASEEETFPIWLRSKLLPKVLLLYLNGAYKMRHAFRAISISFQYQSHSRQLITTIMAIENRWWMSHNFFASFPNSRLLVRRPFFGMWMYSIEWDSPTSEPDTICASNGTVTEGKCQNVRQPFVTGSKCSVISSVSLAWKAAEIRKSNSGLKWNCETRPQRHITGGVKCPSHTIYITWWTKRNASSLKKILGKLHFEDLSYEVVKGFHWHPMAPIMRCWCYSRTRACHSSCKRDDRNNRKEVWPQLGKWCKGKK